MSGTSNAQTRSIGELLAEVSGSSAFATRRTAQADDLQIEIKGIGPLRFPVTKAQARKLRQIARPAHYGHKDRTLLDRNVRDTWQIPKSRVKIDQRRWNRTLRPMLRQLQSDLGLPEHCKLKAELHSMLLYEPGQFFQSHQDSEKSNQMIGTLLVTLPSRYTGGAIVIEHQGEQVTYRATKQPLSFIAFYADCQHEARPIKEGYRLVLTYNLMLEGDTTAIAPPSDIVETLTERIRSHFHTSRPPRFSHNSDAPRGEPPRRLVFLLDHQYTQRSLSTARLKGDDAARVAALREAAERADCDVALALAEVQETWNAMEGDPMMPSFGPQRRWRRTDNEWELEADSTPDPSDPDSYSLEELIDSSVELDYWCDLSGKRGDSLSLLVDEDELAYSTPSLSLQPYASEYEGFMGNWGNTMDRWYRRAAFVLWPRSLSFALQAEADPKQAIKILLRKIRTGAVEETRKEVKTIVPFWPRVAGAEPKAQFVVDTLRVADGLNAPDLAASLLQPFRVEALTQKTAPMLVALTKRYGQAWMRSRIKQWSEDGLYSPGRDRRKWLTTLPRLCQTICTTDKEEGPLTARLLLEAQWPWLQEELAELKSITSPTYQRKASEELAKPMLGFLEGLAISDASTLREQVLKELCSDKKPELLPCLLGLLRRAEKSLASKHRAEAGLPAIHEHAMRMSGQRLCEPNREDHDWSIQPPHDCRCQWCKEFNTFLADSQATRLEWPLKKEGRKHIHRIIEAYELPLHHETHRSGRPYTLMLSKTRDLFERAAAERKRWQADFDWLRKRRTYFTRN